MVGEREKVNVLDHTSQRTVGVAGADCCTLGHVLVSQELNVRELLPTLCQDTWFIRGNVDTWLHFRLCEFLFPEPLLHVLHVFFNRVEGCLGANLVSPPDVNTHDGMLKLEVLHSGVKHGLEMRLRPQHVLEKL